MSDVVVGTTQDGQFALTESHPFTLRPLVRSALA
jgi:hypothetical protein